MAGGMDARRVHELLVAFRPLAALGGVLIVLCGVLMGLEELKQHVYARPELTPEGYKIVLLDPPEWVVEEEWAPRILVAASSPLESVKDASSEGGAAEAPDEGVEGAADTTDDEPGHAEPEDPIARQVHDALAASGWVREIRSVVTGQDGVIGIDAEYRRPVAMIHFKNMRGQYRFVAVDRDGVRLPELYEQVDSDSGWIRIFGVRVNAPPEAGQPFTTDDAQAGVRIAREISEQPYWRHITGITVLNYGGRERQDETHIKLLRRQGASILWGSAIGEEIEEAPWETKLANLGLALKRGVKGEIDLQRDPPSVFNRGKEQALVGLE